MFGIHHHRDAALRTVGRRIPRDGEHVRIGRDGPETRKQSSARIPVHGRLGAQEPPDVVGLSLDKEIEVRQINILHSQGSKRCHRRISFAPATT